MLFVDSRKEFEEVGVVVGLGVVEVCRELE